MAYPLLPAEYKARSDARPRSNRKSADRQISKRGYDVILRLRLLPRTLARSTLGRRRPSHARGRLQCGAPGRVRLGAPGAGRGTIRLRLARPGHGHPGATGHPDRAGHPHRRAAALAGDETSGYPATGRAPPPATPRQPPPRLRQQPGLPGAQPAHRRRPGQLLRRKPPRDRLADRQRVRLPQHQLLLLRPLRRRFPPLAASPLWPPRGPQRRLGHHLLECRLHRLGTDPPALGGAGGSQSRLVAGLPPLLHGLVARLPALAGGPPAPPQSRLVHHPQPDARLHPARLLRPFG